MRREVAPRVTKVVRGMWAAAMEASAGPVAAGEVLAETADVVRAAARAIRAAVNAQAADAPAEAEEAGKARP